MLAKTRGPAANEMKDVPAPVKKVVGGLLRAVRNSQGFAPPVHAARTINFFRDVGVRSNKPVGKSRSGTTLYKITHQGTPRSGLTGYKISYVNHVRYDSAHLNPARLHSFLL